MLYKRRGQGPSRRGGWTCLVSRLAKGEMKHIPNDSVAQIKRGELICHQKRKRKRS